MQNDGMPSTCTAAADCGTGQLPDIATAVCSRSMPVRLASYVQLPQRSARNHSLASRDCLHRRDIAGCRRRRGARGGPAAAGGDGLPGPAGQYRATQVREYARMCAPCTNVAVCVCVCVPRRECAHADFTEPNAYGDEGIYIYIYI